MKKIKWNKGWRVWQEHNAFNLVFAVPEDALEIELPYDAAFHTVQNPDCVSAGSTGFIDGAVFNYYKELIMTPEDIGKTVLLELEGAMSQSYIYVNGSMAGSCSYGYTDHFADLTPYLKAGANRILIVCSTPDRSSRYYAGCGLYRDVWLLEGDGQYLSPESLWFRTLSADHESAVIEISGEITNTAASAKDVTVRFALAGTDGKTVMSADYPVLLHGSGTTPVRKSFCVNAPRLWSDDEPNLYTCSLQILDGDRELDREEVLTGIRTLMIDSKHGLRVNGRSVKLRGACIHHDQGLLGAAAYYDYEYRRVKRLKEAGFNAVRSAHNPAGKALLTACDVLGMYVMDEAFDMWEKIKNSADFAAYFDKGWADVVRAMVRVDRNHPGVVFYSTGNEISEIGTERGYAVSRKMCGLFHDLDPDRYTTNGINGAFAAGNGLIRIAASLTGKDESEFADGDINKFMGLVATAMDRIVQHEVVGGILERMDSTNDVMGYNYMTARYLPDHEAYPQRVMVGTETYPKQIAESWSIIRNCPAVVGDFTWTGADYMGETGGPANYPRLVSGAGDIDYIGIRRPMSYYRELVFGLTEKPRINVRPPEKYGTPRQFGPWKFTDGIRSWTFPADEGKPVTVEVFSNGEEAELYLNGVSVGRKQNGDPTGCYVSFDLTYQPGVLRAVSYRDGAVIGEDTLATASSYHLSVETEEYGSLPGSSGLVFLNAAVLDENGERAVQSDAEISLTLTGDVKLLAYGSIAELHDGGFAKTISRAGEGGTLAVVRPYGSWSAAFSAGSMETVTVKGTAADRK